MNLKRNHLVGLCIREGQESYDKFMGNNELLTNCNLLNPMYFYTYIPPVEYNLTKKKIQYHVVQMRI